MCRRPTLFALYLGLTLIAGSNMAAAQATVNDRLENRPFAAGSRAESYVGLTMTQLLLALGLRLQGVPPQEIRERMDAIRSRNSGEPAPTVATVPVPSSAMH
jgi:hypothetical protein